MVHKKTQALYDAAKVQYTPVTNDYVRMIFEETTKTDKNKRYEIQQIYRLKDTDDQEYVMYNQVIHGNDHLGNEHTCNETVGFHEEPTWTNRIDTETGSLVPAAVSNNKTVFDIPATKQNLQDIINGTYHMKTGEQEKPRTMIPSKPGCYVVADSQKHGGFTVKEFIERHYDDLMYKATNTNREFPAKLKAYGNEEEKPKPEKKETLKQPKKDLLVSQIKPDPDDTESREEQNRRQTITSKDLVIKTRYEKPIQQPPNEEQPRSIKKQQKKVKQKK